MINDDDLSFIEQAILLAYRGEGSVEPNPMVGCVLVRDGVIISSGYHKSFGGPHADVRRWRNCRRRCSRGYGLCDAGAMLPSWQDTTLHRCIDRSGHQTRVLRDARSVSTGERERC